MRNRGERGEPGAGHIVVIDGMRGLACLAVCLFHTSRFTALPQNYYTSAAGWGRLGVDAFFVISGFVIPYSLWRGGYRLGDFGRYFLKRLMRLEPPYLVTAALVALYLWLASLTPWHRGPAPDLSWQRIVLHLGYLNAFFGHPWFLESFWTLAVEFQFYLLIGLLYPLLARRRAWVAPGLVLVAGAGALVPSAAMLPHYLPVFVLGILAFRRRGLGAGGWELGWCGAGVTALGVATLGPAVMGVAVGSAAIILWVRYTSAWLRWLGGISYSLYLIHAWVIDVVVNLGMRLLGQGRGAELLLIPAGLAGALAAAVLLHGWVEVPARRCAERRRYAGARRRAGAARRPESESQPDFPKSH